MPLELQSRRRGTGGCAARSARPTRTAEQVRPSAAAADRARDMLDCKICPVSELDAVGPVDHRVHVDAGAHLAAELSTSRA